MNRTASLRAVPPDVSKVTADIPLLSYKSISRKRFDKPPGHACVRYGQRSPENIIRNLCHFPESPMVLSVIGRAGFL